jgi:hypothetical protein
MRVRRAARCVRRRRTDWMSRLLADRRPLEAEKDNRGYPVRTEFGDRARPAPSHFTWWPDCGVGGNTTPCPAAPRPRARQITWFVQCATTARRFELALLESGVHRAACPAWSSRVAARGRVRSTRRRSARQGPLDESRRGSEWTTLTTSSSRPLARARGFDRLESGFFAQVCRSRPSARQRGVIKRVRLARRSLDGLRRSLARCEPGPICVRRHDRLLLKIRPASETAASIGTGNTAPASPHLGLRGLGRR